jgi:hypothetical protein
MSVELKEEIFCSSGRNLVDMKVVDGLLHESWPIFLGDCFTVDLACCQSFLIFFISSLFNSYRICGIPFSSLVHVDSDGHFLGKNCSRKGWGIGLV